MLKYLDFSKCEQHNEMRLISMQSINVPGYHIKSTNRFILCGNVLSDKKNQK